MSSSEAITNKSVNRLENGNIEIKLTIPWTDINKAYEIKVAETVAQTEIPGFRKGKAPREMVEPKLNRSELISKALGDLLPDAYSKSIDANKLKPILYPQIKIDKGKEGEDWELTVITCEAPQVILSDYKKDVPQLKIKTEHTKLATVLEHLHEKSKVKIPDMLVEEETNHRLSSLVENITQIGLNLEKYLQTKKISAEDLKAQTAQSARRDLEIEFILAQIQSQENLPSRDKTIELIESLIPTTE